MEELDVIDAHDELVGKERRDIVHKKQLLHRGVCVLLFDTMGKLFVQQRAEAKRMFPLHWDCSLSGHVLAGETPQEAAIRELHEELGVCVSLAHLTHITTFGFHVGEERMMVTLYVIRDFKGEIKLDPEEVRCGEFWTLANVQSSFKKKDILINPGFKKAMALFLELDGRTKDFVPAKAGKKTTKK